MRIALLFDMKTVNRPNKPGFVNLDLEIDRHRFDSVSLLAFSRNENPDYSVLDFEIEFSQLPVRPRRHA